ncbi:aldo/keto reductase family protein [Ceratobasidium sp. AG-Ba]|nr:aldo/keto reductase family protein [Ceratobasidium sp. AG-Ba]QRW14645.1 aldo/keto reductase family protein [Ceratobasidium sp. AG-Ba]
MSHTTILAGTPILKIGHGLMHMTALLGHSSNEEGFEAIKAGIEAAPPGVKVFLNSAEFYGPSEDRTANLTLLNNFFTKYPEYAERTVLSVKGALSIGSAGFEVDASEAGIERSIKNIAEKLGPNKKIDVFECARVDPNVPVEITMKALNKQVESGNIGAIGISECSAATLERASKVAKIAAVEIEVSPWSYEEETQKVIAKAAEIGAVVAAYSPLGSGFLTGKVKLENLKPGDFRRGYPRFTGEAAKNNEKVVEALTKIAERKGITPAQLCLAWVSSLGPHVVPIPGSSRAPRTLENMAAALVTLDEQDKADIEHVLKLNPVSGTRYPEYGMGLTWG